MSELGAYLKAQREKRGWTLRQAASRINVSSSRLAEVERGKSYHTDNATTPSRELLQRIAQAYSLPEAFLLAEAGYPTGEMSELSPEARKAVALIEMLSPSQRQLALGILSLMAESCTTESYNG